MISEYTLRDLFEEWTGYHLTVHHGKAESAYRVINNIVEPINGTIEVEPWSYTPIRTVAMATTNATVTVIARTDDEARQIQEHINGAMDEIRGTAHSMRGEDGTAIALSVMAGTAQRSEAVHGSLYGRGDEFDVTIRIGYIATVFGVSSADTMLFIDGEQVELEEITSSMVHASEDHPGDDGVTTTATPSRAFGIEASAVLLSNAVGDLLLREALSLSDPLTVHCVEYRVKNTPHWYMMAFTRCQLGSKDLNNVGVSFSLMTASAEAMEFDGRWNSAMIIGDTTAISADVGAIVFWGDHTSERVGENRFAEHVYSDGIGEHVIHVFGGYEVPITRELRLGDNLEGKRLIYIGDEWDVSGMPDQTLISCESNGLNAASLGIESGRLREVREDGVVSQIVGGDILYHMQEWKSYLGTVNGIADASLWHVYVSELEV